MREPLAGAREQLRQRRRQRRLVPKPPWLTHFEQRIAGHIPLHPNVISAAKLVVVTPLMLLGLRQLDTLPHIPLLIGLLFAAFALLDYLDGAVARARGLATHFGRVFDRVTDYPLLVFLSAFCVDVLPLSLLALKLSFDLALLVLYAVGRGSTENRLRTMMSYSTLGAWCSCCSS
jgi:phosphatidylglycerophosphate synthase